MKLEEVFRNWDAVKEGEGLHRAIAALYPICRSITGDGFRKSVGALRKFAPIELHEVPSGTQVFDWTVPKEWNIRDGWIKNSKGEKIVDFQKSNLHVLNYSVPVRRKVGLKELREHLFTMPEKPDWVPYRTSYYKENWGFCMAHRQAEGLRDEEYEVCVESSLEPGHLTYGELRLGGEWEEEVLISVHSCHPSLCNDNLSGMVVAARLAEILGKVSRRYSYRFVWIPGTIGSITWLATHEEAIARVRHGLVLSCVGDGGRFTYKRSRRGRAEIDRAVEQVLRTSGKEFEVMDFSPYGYDERQYCSPGLNLAVGCFMRTPNGKYPEYHTSADNLELVKAGALAESLRTVLLVVEVLESDETYVNLFPKGEPQLGRRGLYRQMGGTNSSGFEEAMLWVLNFSDGEHSLLEIAERAKLPFQVIRGAADALAGSGVIRKGMKKG